MIRLDQDGHRLSEPGTPGGGVAISIDRINDRGGAMLEPSALRAIKRSVRVYTELSGLLGARIQAKLEPSTDPGGPFDLWLLVEVPLGDTKAARNIPTKLLGLPPAATTPR
jgi:hypothetical protein